jgi:hypothetical protein
MTPVALGRRGRFLLRARTLFDGDRSTIFDGRRAGGRLTQLR